MSMEFKDFYQALGVESSASQKEIKSAFRKLAQEHHPDANKSSGSEARFKEISEAYEVLKDREKRAEYDKLYDYWKRGGSFHQGATHGTGSAGFNGGDFGFDIGDLFEKMFGESSGGFQRNVRFHNGIGGAGGAGSMDFGFGSTPQPQAHEVEITLEEAFHGCQRQFELMTPDGGRKRIRVKIPAGAGEGRIIRMADKARTRTGSAGDLFFKIRIRPHRRFRVYGKEIHLDLPVAPWEAALGATVKVPTLDGVVNLKIPPASQAGAKLKLKGRGLPGSPTGDQVVTLKIVVPKPRNEAQRELYEKMAMEMAFDPREGF